MKNSLKFFLFSTLMLVCSFAFAQKNTDFQGTWNGVDKEGNAVELQLNTSMTCVLKINGSAVYNISAYRIYDGKAIAGPDAEGETRGIKFYTNSNSAVPSNSSTLTSSTPAIVTYDGQLKITKADLQSTMHLSFSLTPSSPLLDFDLTK